MKKILALLTILFSLIWLIPVSAQVVDLPQKAKEHFSKSRYADCKVNSYNAIESNKGKKAK